MRSPNDPKRVLLVYYSYSPFVENDYRILSKAFRVGRFEWRGKRDLARMTMAVKKSDIVFTWFARDHAAAAVFFSRLFRKASIVVVGGGDIAHVPEINYGTFVQSRLKRVLSRYALKNADKVLVVDPSLKEDAMRNAGVSGENIGYLPTGYDSEYWKPSSKIRKEQIVLTVGGISWDFMKRKGYETFVEAAAMIPDARFVLVGRVTDESFEYLKKTASDNVTFTGFVSNSVLLDWYRRATVYCQLSRYEGLPNALCEAMLCECIPIGTRYGGIPTAMGDVGFYVPYGDAEATAEAIREAFGRPERGGEARERISELFSLQRRGEGLTSTIGELLS